MLSMLIDRLRSHADLYDGTKEPSLEPKLQRPWLARELREAADTIWQLRDDLQRANAENAKLRELCSALYEFAYDEYPDSAELNFADRLRELGVEVDA